MESAVGRTCLKYSRYSGGSKSPPALCGIFSIQGVFDFIRIDHVLSQAMGDMLHCLRQPKESVVSGHF